METLSQKQKRDVIIRMGRRHQSDVCIAIFVTHDLVPCTLKANTAEELGFHFASMFYIDRELVTVGTRKGKSYLNSHPAIMSHFLYGIVIVILV